MLQSQVLFHPLHNLSHLELFALSQLHLSPHSRPFKALDLRRIRQRLALGGLCLEGLDEPVVDALGRGIERGVGRKDADAFCREREEGALDRV